MEVRDSIVILRVGEEGVIQVRFNPIEEIGEYKVYLIIQNLAT